MSDPEARPSRTVLFVLGMHRTGTSLTTAVLNALGVSLSEDLMPPTQFNAMGYFESVTISKIHDNLLAALGSSWKTSELLTPFPANWWQLPQIAPFKDQLKAQVTNELSRVPGVWGFKDPRTARLLPLWNGIVAEMGLDARYVLVVRDPRDVAKSLYTREQIHPALSELLWLEHYADIIGVMGNRLNAVVEYDAWFEDGLKQAEYMIRGLGFEMPPRTEIEAVLQRLISKDLRHHQSTAALYELPYSGELYNALKRRDFPAMQMVAQLFGVTKAFGTKMVGMANQGSVERLAQAVQALQSAASRIASLENDIASLRGNTGTF